MSKIFIDNNQYKEELIIYASEDIDLFFNNIEEYKKVFDNKFDVERLLSKIMFDTNINNKILNERFLFKLLDQESLIKIVLLSDINRYIFVFNTLVEYMDIDYILEKLLKYKNIKVEDIDIKYLYIELRLMSIKNKVVKRNKI